MLSQELIQTLGDTASGIATLLGEHSIHASQSQSECITGSAQR